MEAPRSHQYQARTSPYIPILVSFNRYLLASTPGISLSFGRTGPWLSRKYCGSSVQVYSTELRSRTDGSTSEVSGMWMRRRE